MQEWAIAREIAVFIQKYCSCKVLPSMCQIIREQAQVRAHWGGQGSSTGNDYWLVISDSLEVRWDAGVRGQSWKITFPSLKENSYVFLSSVWLQGCLCKQLTLFSGVPRVMTECSCPSACPLLLVFSLRKPNGPCVATECVAIHTSVTLFSSTNYLLHCKDYL